jgi:sporulation protein YqfC
MLDVINNALRCNDYYVCLYSNKVYIYNYMEIISFNNNCILIKLCNQNIKIIGSKMHIKKMENHELLIEGVISGVSYE